MGFRELNLKFLGFTLFLTQQFFFEIRVKIPAAHFQIIIGGRTVG